MHTGTHFLNFFQMFPNYYVDPDMDNFWDPEYKVQNVRQGCLAVCAMRALRLIYRDGRINVANVRRFIASNNAGSLFFST